jgi:hypothetical protein
VYRVGVQYKNRCIQKVGREDQAGSQSHLGGKPMKDIEKHIERDIPPEGHLAAVNGMEMYYEVHGEGSPLILLQASVDARRCGDFT